jgi:hypothetical protein
MQNPLKYKVSKEIRLFRNVTCHFEWIKYCLFSRQSFIKRDNETASIMAIHIHILVVNVKQLRSIEMKLKVTMSAACREFIASVNRTDTTAY